MPTGYTSGLEHRLKKQASSPQLPSAAAGRAGRSRRESAPPDPEKRESFGGSVIWEDLKVRWSPISSTRNSSGGANETLSCASAAVASTSSQADGVVASHPDTQESAAQGARCAESLASGVESGERGVLANRYSSATTESPAQPPNPFSIGGGSADADARMNPFGSGNESSEHESGEDEDGASLFTETSTPLPDCGDSCGDVPANPFDVDSNAAGAASGADATRPSNPFG